MTLLNLFVFTYRNLHNYKHIPFYVLSPLRYLVRFLANKILPFWFKHTAIPSRRPMTDVIVSFTSFPARINNVWQVVECMMRQTIMPQKIILWLSKEQFPTRESIPISLRNRENDFFEIRMVDGNIKSHKKYIYVCEEYPNNPILLIDDDIYYHTNFLKDLYQEYQKNKGVVCYYCFEMAYDKQGNLLPYNCWTEIEYERSESNNLFFGSGGGIIFTPSMLYKDVTNAKIATQLTPLADDIWLNAMARLGNQKILKIKSGLHMPIIQGANNTNLFSANVSDGGNDVQIQAINKYYKDKLNKIIF